MARTKGAADKRPRKRSDRGPTGQFLKKNVNATSERSTKSPATPESQPTNAVGGREFEQAVAGVLGESQTLPGGPQAANPDPHQSPGDSPAASVVFGLEAWEAVIQAPFRSAAIWFGIPAFEQLGQMRAKMIAEPSYPLYRHYVAAWLTDNPDDELFVAKMMTGAALVTVLQEAWLILKIESAKRQGAQPKGPTVPIEAIQNPNPN
jgi:hypothetical protein